MSKLSRKENLASIKQDRLSELGTSAETRALNLLLTKCLMLGGGWGLG